MNGFLMTIIPKIVILKISIHKNDFKCPPSKVQSTYLVPLTNHDSACLPCKIEVPFNKCHPRSCYWRLSTHLLFKIHLRVGYLWDRCLNKLICTWFQMYFHESHEFICTLSAVIECDGPRIRPVPAFWLLWLSARESPVSSVLLLDKTKAQ